MEKKEVQSFLKNEKVRWAVTIIALIVIISLTSSLRTDNWDLLTDQITGEKIPLALDPYYFLRVAETIVANGGTLPDADPLRYTPNVDLPWTFEIMPQVMVGLWNTANIFGEYTLREVAVFSPVFFYIVGIFLFFLLVYLLTQSRLAALLGVVLLGYSPAYLYRTMAGFSDHESIGMMALFACLCFFVWAFKRYEKRPILLGLGLGVLTSLSLASWSGAVSLVIVAVPFAVIMHWLMNKPKQKPLLFFFVSWAVFSLVSSRFISQTVFDVMVAKFSSTYGLIIPAVLGFILIDMLLDHKSLKKKVKQEHRILYILGSLVVLGSIFLALIGKSLLGVITSAWQNVLFPFGRQRVGLTVAENAQPYLSNWIGQSGSYVFWLFVLGIFLVGWQLRKAVKTKSRGILFALSWMIMISAMIFSRISASSPLNGENFLSQAMYLVGVGIFGIYFVWLLMKQEFGENKVSSSLLIIMALSFIVVLNGRSAVRAFFLIAPFVIVAVSYFVITLFRYAYKNKEETTKVLLWGLFLFALAGVLFSANAYKETANNQARFTAPSANIQWQSAMSWVRDNTPQDAIFSHWWDYGYWVQTLGERATIADGGRFQGSYRDHLIGRYLLTSQDPDQALSFLKSNNASYLLIDPTDLGKYGAYSRIGSDEQGSDRFSAIPVMRLDPRQTVETANGTTLVYTGGLFVDQDILYTNNDGRQILLPEQRAAIAGVLWQTGNENADGQSTLQRPVGVYVYNNQRYDIPLRYAYLEGTGILDFGDGLEATVRIIPSFDGQQIAPLGAAIYLSPKVTASMYAQLYLLDNTQDSYGDFALVHSQDDTVIQNLKQQGAPIGDFIYFQGFRGPIKIWEVNPSQDIAFHEEFTVMTGQYAEFDDLNPLKIES